MTEAFFDLPDEVKRQYPLAGNAGWESKSAGSAIDPHAGSKRVVSDNAAADGRALAQRSGVASIQADDARV
ncbi:Oxidoreductase [Klebsiella aerogenes]|nr:Oxidoreductase [Klebsiella aerogenes]